MNACTTISAFQLTALAFMFILAVISLDMFWAMIPEKPHRGDIDGALRKRNWLNVFVAVGSGGAVVLLLHWATACTNGEF
jgi:hypothetical protein